MRTARDPSVSEPPWKEPITTIENHPMLVLTRKNRESVVIGRGESLGILLEITVLEIEGGRVRLGFQCDPATPIHRREVWERICNEQNGHNGHVNGHVDGHSNGHVVPVAMPRRTTGIEGGRP